MPIPFAVDAERRWLTLADSGAKLEWDTPDAVREDVLRTFARLQIEAASQVDRLLEAGCLDRRLPWLADQAERWLPAVEETGRIPSVAHPFLDLLTFFQEDEEELEGSLRDRLRDAYLSGWAAFEPPERLRRAWQLAEPLSALNQAISYRSIVADLAPVERHTAQSPAYWLRKVLAGLRQVGRVHR